MSNQPAVRFMWAWWATRFMTYRYVTNSRDDLEMVSPDKFEKAMATGRGQVVELVAVPMDDLLKPSKLREIVERARIHRIMTLSGWRQLQPLEDVESLDVLAYSDKPGGAVSTTPAPANAVGKSAHLYGGRLGLYRRVNQS